MSELKLLKIFSRVSYFREKIFQCHNPLVKEREVNKEGRDEYFYKINLQKTAQKDRRNLRASKVIVIMKEMNERNR